MLLAHHFSKYDIRQNTMEVGGILLLVFTAFKKNPIHLIYLKETISALQHVNCHTI